MTEDRDDLLRRAAEGDAAAVGALLQRYVPGLRAFVRLRAGPLVRAKESSGDLVQSVCRELLEQAHRFHTGDEAGFKQWLYRTALRKISNRYEYYRAAKRDVGREVHGEAHAGPSTDAEVLECYQSFCTPSQHATSREELERVERSFDRLPERDREVILQARLMGQSSADIAKSTGRTEGAVRTQLSRAIARLAEFLDED